MDVSRASSPRRSPSSTAAASTGRARSRAGEKEVHGDQAAVASAAADTTAAIAAAVAESAGAESVAAESASADTATVATAAAESASADTATVATAAAESAGTDTAAAAPHKRALWALGVAAAKLAGLRRPRCRPAARRRERHDAVRRRPGSPRPRLRKRRISHRPPTGYAPLLDSTEGPDSTAKGRDRRRNGSRTSSPASGAGVEQPTGGA